MKSRPDASRIHRELKLGRKSFPFSETTFTVSSSTRTARSFADSRVRRALNYAVDRAAIIDQVFKGHGKPQRLRHGPSTGHMTRPFRSLHYDPAEPLRYWMPRTAKHSTQTNRSSLQLDCDFTCIFPKTFRCGSEWR